MQKLNNKQKILIKNFIKNNPSAPQFLPVEVIDDTGEIENCNMYDNCWSDIERYYSDMVKPLTMIKNLNYRSV